MTQRPGTPDPGRMRLDKWLWHARFFRSRGLAARAVEEGSVRLNAERVLKPATAVGIGDGLTFVHGGQVRVVRVLALGLRRGPAPEARMLYEEIAPGAPLAAAPLARAGAVDR